MIRAHRILAPLFLFAGLPVLAAATLSLAAAQPSGEVDLLIKGGQVVDGSGGPRMQADVAITGARPT
jgi:hypothetical protein